MDYKHFILIKKEHNYCKAFLTDYQTDKDTKLNLPIKVKKIKLEDNYNLDNLDSVNTLDIDGKTHYQCYICLKFVPKLLYHVHLKHFPELKNRCTICNKQFPTPTALINHTSSSVHEGKPNSQCKVCHKIFPNLRRLKVHIIIHSDEKPFDCDICFKRFRYEKSLESHIASHSDDRPYDCEICDKKFKTKSAVRVHKQTHRDERPFQCGICKKSFKQHSGLYIHKRQHNKNKTETVYER